MTDLRAEAAAGVLVVAFFMMRFYPRVTSRLSALAHHACRQAPQRIASVSKF